MSKGNFGGKNVVPGGSVLLPSNWSVGVEKGWLKKGVKCGLLILTLSYLYSMTPGGNSGGIHMFQLTNLHEIYPFEYSFIDKTGKVVIHINQYHGVRSFSDGLAAVYSANKGWGFIDKTGRVVIEQQFEEVGDFSEELAGIQLGGEWGFIDKTGRVVIEPSYDFVNGFSEGITVAAKGETVILLDKTGRTILSRNINDLELNIYENARFSEGLIEAYDNGKGKYGFIDKTGEFVVKPEFNQAGPFVEGLARVTSIVDGEEKVGFIDRSGRFMIPPQFNTDADFRRNSSDFSEGLAGLSEGLRPTVTQEEKFFYIDRKGAIVLSTDFFYAGSFHDGMAVVYNAELNKWGFINKSGKVVIPLRYDLASDFSEGLACVAIRRTKGHSR